MSETITKEAIGLIAYLLPGFVAAWIFYALTSHPKPSQFERTVQAIIFTFAIQVTLPAVRWILFLVGGFVALGKWDEEARQAVSLVLALFLGFVLAYYTNSDKLHRFLRKLKITNRTSHPSEWYCVFSEKVTLVILHLIDGRRLYGWPKEWPIEPGKGQFYMMIPSWIDENDNLIDLPQLDGILISAKEVKWVEFLQPVGESK